MSDCSFQPSLFPNMELRPALSHRRPRTAAAVVDPTIMNRRSRLEKRNRVLAARWYYWTEIRRIRFDDVLIILADREFFVEARTISNVLVQQDQYISRLYIERPSPRELREQYPGFDFTP